jgi:hypothetical protein
MKTILNLKSQASQQSHTCLGITRQSYHESHSRARPLVNAMCFSPSAIHLYLKTPERSRCIANLALTRTCTLISSEFVGSQRSETKIKIQYASRVILPSVMHRGFVLMCVWYWDYIRVFVRRCCWALFQADTKAQLIEGEMLIYKHIYIFHELRH